MTVPRAAPPEGRVGAMFDAIVHRYDLVNDVLSFGLDRWWRRRAAAAIEVSPFELVLDLGCGTGRLAERLAGEHRVVGVDLSGPMLLAARERLRPRARVPLVRGSAFRLPFRDGAFGGVASAFVLRNLRDLAGAFGEAARVLRAGGQLALVDITEPRSPAFRRAFDAYFGTVAPALGSLVGRREAYRYLVRSLAQLPPPAEVADVLRGSGFDGVRHRSLFPGAVTLWTGRRRA